MGSIVGATPLRRDRLHALDIQPLWPDELVVAHLDLDTVDGALVARAGFESPGLDLEGVGASPLALAASASHWTCGRFVSNRESETSPTTRSRLPSSSQVLTSSPLRRVLRLGGEDPGSEGQGAALAGADLVDQLADLGHVVAHDPLARFDIGGPEITRVEQEIEFEITSAVWRMLLPTFESWKKTSP